MILASKSPRRFEILQNFGIKNIKVIIPDIEEISDKIKIEDQIMDIAQKKGLEIAKDYNDEFIVSADTVVILGNLVLGKPKDKKEAFETLKKLSNRDHRVVTAYSIINKAKNIEIVGYDETIVTFKKLEDSDINYYISTNEPMDKAGSYGIQGVGAGILIDSMKGEFYNVMGFPISKFVEDLKEKNIKIQDIINL